ncbi:MAG TPA: peptide chain release factor 1 [Crinalium sp.]|jgi:hypothetical protein
MNDPIRRLKAMPWLTLFQVATVTILIVSLLEFALLFLIFHSLLAQQTLSILFAPPLDMILALAIAGSIGALAVFIMERFFRRIIINTANLWGLVLCLIIMIFVRLLSPFPSLFLNSSQTYFIGIMLGVFFKGVKYWRR